MRRRMNRAQSAAYLRRQEVREQEEREDAKAREEAKHWTAAEGPVPENLLQVGAYVTEFGPKVDGTRVYRVIRIGELVSERFYLGSAHFLGWRWTPCLKVDG